MATTLDLPAVLHGANLRVQLVDGWDNNTFTPIGHVWHDTVGPGRQYGDAPTLNYIARTAAYAPLANIVVGYSGTLYLVTVGKANHAGSGLKAVYEDSLQGRPPGDYPNYSSWAPWRNMTGNSYYVGWEVECRGGGTEDWTDEQKLAVVEGSAALNVAFGWSANAGIGHKEWSPGRKVDPFTIGCSEMRGYVTAAMKPPTPPPPPQVIREVGKPMSWKEQYRVITTDSAGQGWAEAKVKTSDMRGAPWVRLGSDRHPTVDGYDPVQVTLNDLNGWAHLVVTAGRPRTQYAVFFNHR